MRKLTLEIASPPDRGNLVAEIWYGNEMLAEINQEGDELEIELYLTGTLKFKYKDLIGVLIEAKAKLIGI